MCLGGGGGVTCWCGAEGRGGNGGDGGGDGGDALLLLLDELQQSLPVELYCLRWTRRNQPEHRVWEWSGGLLRFPSMAIIHLGDVNSIQRTLFVPLGTLCQSSRIYT